MKKFFTTIATIATITASLFMLFSLSACGNINHNAVIVAEGITYKTEWLENNRTYGTYYENPDYEPETEGSEQTLTDTSSPKSRTYVIEDRTELNEIFTQFPAVDFEKEMVVVYCFTTIYNRERVLEKVASDENNVLYIEFKSKSNDGRGDASMPGTAVLTIRMDRLEATDVKIIYHGQ